MSSRRRLMSMPSKPPGDSQAIGALRSAVHQAVGGAGLSPEVMATARLVSASVTYAITDENGLARTVTIPIAVPS